MNSIVAWFKSKNITSHTIVAFLIAGATLITSDEQVRSLLVSAFVHHPKIIANVILIAGIIMKYSRDSSSQGAAKNILSDASAGPASVLVKSPLPNESEATAVATTLSRTTVILPPPAVKEPTE
jgi:hypothetical protein